MSSENKEPEIRTKCCKTCYYCSTGNAIRGFYGQYSPEGAIGRCHRYPPVYDGSDTLWPPVKATWWCGEYADAKSTEFIQRTNEMLI